MDYTACFLQCYVVQNHDVDSSGVIEITAGILQNQHLAANYCVRFDVTLKLQAVIIFVNFNGPCEIKDNLKLPDYYVLEI